MCDTTMQRRHFQLIAGVVSGLPVDMRDLVAARFADRLNGTNVNFNRERFIEACRIDHE